MIDVYDLLLYEGQTVQLNGAVVDRVLQAMGDMYFLASAALVLLVLILGVLCVLAFRAK